MADNLRFDAHSLNPPDSVQAMQNRPILRFAPWLIALPSAIAALVCLAALMGSLHLGQWSDAQLAEATLQITPQPSATPEQNRARAARLTQTLAARPEVLEVQPVAPQILRQQLEIWLGPEVLSQSAGPLPIPQLYTVSFDSKMALSSASLSQLAHSLEPPPQAGLALVNLIDNRRWSAELRAYVRLSLALLLVLGGFVVLSIGVLVAFVVRMSLVANRTVIDQLHSMGATLGYLRREFRRLAWRIGWMGGLLGLLLALLVVAILLLTTAAHRLAFIWSIDSVVPLLLLLLLLPLFVGGIASLAAQVTVWRMVRSKF